MLCGLLYNWSIDIDFDNTFWSAYIRGILCNSGFHRVSKTGRKLRPGMLSDLIIWGGLNAIKNGLELASLASNQLAGTTS